MLGLVVGGRRSGRTALIPSAVDASEARGERDVGKQRLGSHVARALCGAVVLLGYPEGGRRNAPSMSRRKSTFS
eukprot:2724874-Pyramimonas_sp.AAC.1